MDDRVRDNLACLVSSPYRGPILARLASGDVTRRELQDRTGASKATVSRTLKAFQNRGWIETNGGKTSLTPLGHIVAEAVADLTNTLGTAAQLRELVDHLPLEEFPFDLARLSDAQVIPVRKSDPFAALRHVDRFLVDAPEIQILSSSFTLGVIEVLTDRVTAGADVTVVLQDAVVDAIADDEEVRAALIELVECTPNPVIVTNESVEHILAVAHGTVSMGVVDDDGGLVGVIDSDDPIVREWARSTVIAATEHAEPLDPNRLRG